MLYADGLFNFPLTDGNLHVMDIRETIFSYYKSMSEETVILIWKSLLHSKGNRSTFVPLRQ